MAKIPLNEMPSQFGRVSVNIPVQPQTLTDERHRRPRNRKPTPAQIADAKLLLQRAGYVVVMPEIRYKCPECDAIIPDGERRCADCNKFGSKIEVFKDCPACSEPVPVEEA